VFLTYLDHAGETALAEPSNWLTLLMHIFVGW